MNHLWHPCSQMKDYDSFPPLDVVGAQGSYLHLKDGRRIIDAISSWWCKSLGHGHPRLKAALARQADSFEHVILANTVNDTITALSDGLAALCPGEPGMPGLSRVFYAGDGSTAVEVAVKMALHAQRLAGHSERTRFLALENGYHGETALTLALSDVGLYREAYRDILPALGESGQEFLRGIPYVASRRDPLWADASAFWPALEKQLESRLPTLCALVIEPLLQGAGGMRIWSADGLRRLREWTRAHGVYLIADEILTGFGRTGSMLACEQAGIVPDFICLSKGLTAGWLPMSAVLTREEIYGLFYGDYGTGRDFLHSNTYAGNALAAAVALEALRIYKDEAIPTKAALLEEKLGNALGRVQTRTGRLKNLRFLGGMAAAELDVPASGSGPGRRTGFKVYREAVARGALLRTLGDTVYWLPPLNTAPETISELEEITVQALLAALP
jgi:adenosylmethionine-8-amino-7-oxononanoate aminotransferase